MLEINNGRLGAYGAEHSKCNHMMKLGFKGLRCPTSNNQSTQIFIQRSKSQVNRKALAF